MANNQRLNGLINVASSGSVENIDLALIDGQATFRHRRSVFRQPAVPGRYSQHNSLCRLVLHHLSKASRFLGLEQPLRCVRRLGHGPRDYRVGSEKCNRVRVF